jgi:hypothetical protein
MTDEPYASLLQNPILELAYGHTELAILESLRAPRGDRTSVPVPVSLAHHCAGGLRTTNEAGRDIAESYRELWSDGSLNDGLDARAEQSLPWPVYRTERFYLSVFACLDAIAVACGEVDTETGQWAMWNLFRSRLFRLRHRGLPPVPSIEARIDHYDSTLEQSQQNPIPVDKGRWLPAVLQFTDLCYTASPLPESFPVLAVALNALSGLTGQLKAAIEVLRENGW